MLYICIWTEKQTEREREREREREWEREGEREGGERGTGVRERDRGLERDK